MCSKSQCHKPYGFLKQLLIPEQPWNSISMDFIKQLLDSLGYTAILMIICRLLKQGIFILTHNTITVHWSGYEGIDKETSWILVTKLGHTSEIVTEFHAAYPANPRPWVP